MAETRLERLQAIANEDASTAPAAAEGGIVLKVPSPNRGEDAGMGGKVREFAGKLAGRMLDPLGLSKIVDMVPTAEENDTWVGTAARTALGAAKGASFGALGTGLAVLDEVQGRLAGTDDLSFGERRGARNEEVDSKSNIGGEILGSIFGAPGKLILKADEIVKNAGKLGEIILSRNAIGLGSRATLAGSLGAGETFAYSLAEGNSVKEASKDAIFGLAFGAAGQMGGEAIGALLKFTDIGPRLGFKTDLEVAEAMVANLKATHGEEYIIKKFGRSMLDPARIAADMANPDTRIMEQFPTALLGNVKKALKSDNPEVYGEMVKLQNFLVNRANSARPEFKSVTSQVLGTPQVRSMDGVVLAGKELRESLIPMYNKALTPARLNPKYVYPSGKAKPVKAEEIHKMIDSVFRNKNLPAIVEIKKGLKSQVADTMSPSQLYDLRKKMDDIIYGGMIPKSAGYEGLSSLDKTIIKQNLLPLRRKIKAKLYDIAPDMKKLDDSYATDAAYMAAYEAGEKLLTGKRSSVESVQLFEAATDRSAGETAGFLEGMKRKLITDLEGKTAPQINKYFENNDEKMKILASLIGQDGVDTMKEAANHLALSATLAKAVARDAPANLDFDKKILPGLLNMTVAGSGATGYSSQAAGLGAMGRILNGQSPSSGNVGRASAASGLYQQGSGVGAEMVNEQLLNNLPTLFRGLPAFAPVASGDQ
jgi:hypothetical protein